jgi:hypothetical protein
MRDDAGRIPVTLPAERTLTIACDWGDGKPMDIWLRGCTDAAGKAVLFSRLDAMDRPGSIKIAVRCQGALKVTLGDPSSGIEREVQVPAGAKADTPLKAVFPLLRKFEITVLDEAGKPVERANFHGFPANQQFSIPSVASDKEGKIAFAAAPEVSGRFLVSAGAAHAPYVGKLAAGADVFRETVRLKPPDATLSGRATDDDGKGLAGVRISVIVCIDPSISTGFEVTADKDGNYTTPIASGVEVMVQAIRQDIMAVGMSGRARVAPGQKVKLDVTVVDRTKPRKQPAPQPERRPEAKTVDQF